MSTGVFAHDILAKIIFNLCHAMISAFFYGLILAFGLILPLGPQNMFILNQGSRGQHFKHALPAVITAGICDSALILLASLGVSLFILQHLLIEKILLVIGILFLGYMGISIWRSAKRTQHASKKSKTRHLSPKKQILFCASVSIFNPHAILDSVAVIGMNAMLFKGPAHIAFTVACIVVSWTWFTSLALFGRFISRYEKFKFYQDRFSAIVILLSAANLLYRFMLIVHL